MQIVVISDTHGHYDMLKKTLEMHADAALAIHCGDGQFDTERWLKEHPEWKGRLIRVRGNCDYDRSIPLQETVSLPFGHRALVLHGHTLMHGDFQQNLIDRAKAENADLVLFGHLHTRIDRMVQGVHLFNPGSAAQPRDQFPPGFGLIDIMEAGILTSHGNLIRSPFHDML
ncbi:MAG: YfcE family phosphodiesterase [Oscillospiraceae bacterium]|nr:YfcE family phosphodiesterase [Oscillospiraceae bacterium]